MHFIFPSNDTARWRKKKVQFAIFIVNCIVFFVFAVVLILVWVKYINSLLRFHIKL